MAGESITRQLKVLIFGLVVGTCSIILAGAFRDVLDAMFQMAVPISEKSLNSSGYLFLWRLLYFIIVLAILVILSILLV
jgi:hypothetical protein